MIVVWGVPKVIGPALVIDESLGQQQVVVKSQERSLHKFEGLRQQPIFWEGRVAPVVERTAIAGLNFVFVRASRRKDAARRTFGHARSASLLHTCSKGQSSYELV